MPTIRTITAEVVGDTLNLQEQETDLATTPLAEVPTDTALDSIIGVKDGVPKQVALADMKSALDALETVQTSSASGDGITVNLVKRYGICTMIISGGTLSTDLPTTSAILAIPSGYRPAVAVEFPTSNLTNGARMVVTTTGEFRCLNMNLGSGTAIRGSVTYVCA